MAMKFWDNLKICGAYLRYLFVFLWMLTKEFLGYKVDWSCCPPFTPVGRNQETNSHSSNPKIRHGVNEKSKDLEANLNSAQSASTIVLEDSEKTASEEKLNDGCDTGHFVIYEAHPRKAIPDIVTDHKLASQTLPLPPVLSEPRSQQQTLAEAKNSPGVQPNAPTVTQPGGKDAGRVNSYIEGLVAKAFKDALREHQQFEDATTSRLDFVKGLKYIENNNFRFPAILSALRAKSINPRRAPKRGTLVNLSPSTTIPPITTARPYTKSEASALFTATPTIPETTPALRKSSFPHPPSLFLPPVRTSSASSVSSYSSTYTVVEPSYANPATPVDEDIPINFNCSLPTWRRDPDRAKFMFGSLTRSIADLNVIGESKVGITSDSECYLMSSGNSKAEGEQRGSTEDMIILAKGSSSLPTASTLHSDSGIIKDKGESQEKTQPSSEQYDGGPVTGLAASLMNVTVKSRKSIMSDLLCWVESTSSIGYQ